MENTRLETIDIAKAICIILVVIGHYSPDNSPYWWLLINKIIYSFHMPLFIFASGYIYMRFKKSDSYYNFIIKKLKRLMIPYVSTSLIIITIKLFSQNNLYVQHPVSIFTYLQIFYIPSAGYFLWFIWTLFLFFVIIPIFNSSKSLLALLLISIVLFIIPVSLPHDFCLKEAKDMLIFFVLGTYIAKKKWKIRYKKQTSLLTSILIFVFFLSIPSYTEIPFLLSSLYKILVSLTGTFIICIISNEISLKNTIMKKGLLYLSPAVYMIYLFHTTFEGLAKSLIYKFISSVESPFIFLFIAIVVVSIGIVIPVLLYYFVLNKNKVTAFMFGLKYSQKPR